MPTSLSNITVKDSAHSLVIKSNDITIDGTSILGQNNFVTLDTAQTILGKKTFSTEIIQNKSTSGYTGFYSQNTAITRGTTPSSNSGITIGLQDSTGLNSSGRLAAFQLQYNTDGNIQASMIAGEPVSGSSDNARISLFNTATGTAYTSAPTPMEDTTTSKQIDTVGARNTKLYKGITNCITYIPQDIKLEINSNGKAVLKAGSKVYVPNGFTGTTPKFDVNTIASDITYNFQSSQNGKYLLANHNNGQNAGWSKANLAESGTSTESNTSFYYRTDDNKVYYLNDSSGGIYTLPLAIVNLTNGVATIDQVFNGFGYIGSTAFALPGVKGLIPNGRNEDGSLKNIEFITSTVYTRNLTQTGTYYMGLTVSGIAVSNLTNSSYNENENINYSGTVKWFASPYCICLLSSGVITSLTPKTPFHAVDYNDFSDLKDIVDNTVKLTGNQTINGAKTFTASPVISNNITDTSLFFKDTGIASNSTVPTADRLRSFRVMANDNTILGDVRFVRQSSGNVTSQLTCRKVIDGTQYNSAVTANVSSTGIIYGTCPTPPAVSNTTDAYIATTAWCNDPIKSTNVVHRNGNETIGGTKTFNTTYTSFKGTAIDITNAKTTQNDVGINWLDKNGTVLGQNHIRTDTTGSVANSMYIKAHNSNSWVSITVGFDTNDNVYTHAPTPAVSSNNTNIATTAYVNNKFQVVSALPASPDSNVFYFIPA